MTMNGAFTSGSHSESGAVVIFASSMETPVTPPSMKLLDSRNPFNPMLAARMPRPISSALSSSRRNEVTHEIVDQLAASGEHNRRRTHGASRGVARSPFTRQRPFEFARHRHLTGEIEAFGRPFTQPRQTGPLHIRRDV